MPRAAVQKSVSGFYSHGLPVHSGRYRIQDAFALALEAARNAGELPEKTDVEEVAGVLSALAMDALYQWSRGDRRKLRTVLQRRAAVVIDGVRPDTPAPSPNGRKTGR